MDNIVKQAMAKWPNVPDCYGWLGLDGRGYWYMRDEATQALGSFANHKGSRLEHDGLIAFIARNYLTDAQGRWYFQNGPQKVFVSLAHTPWVWRVNGGEVFSHTGLSTKVKQCWVDETGRVYLDTELGFGLLQSPDVGWVADMIEQKNWQTRDVLSAELPDLFAYVCEPQPSKAGPLT